MPPIDGNAGHALVGSLARGRMHGAARGISRARVARRTFDNSKAAAPRTVRRRWLIDRPHIGGLVDHEPIVPSHPPPEPATSSPSRTRVQRRHAPRKLGPRLEHRGRYWVADLRPWGGG